MVANADVFLHLDEVKAIPEPYQVRSKIIIHPKKFIEMGTLRKGILGGFSGKVGSVVGASWKGISYMRSLPLKVRNPRTLPQRSQRSKFALSLGLLQPMTAFLRTGWKLYAYKQSPFNAAMSHTINNAIVGDYPDYEIDASKLLVSRGSLTPAINVSVDGASGNLELSWVDNSGINSAKPNDRALIAVLNLERGEAVTDNAGAERAAGTQTVMLPADWSGNSVEAYLGFISEDGREVANSVYLGHIAIT
jgi:hypothetical protein